MSLLPAHRQARTVVIDAESEHAIGAKRGNPYCAALHSFRDSMFDRVFHHGLQNQAGNLSWKEFPGDIHAELQALGKSHLLNVQILLCELQFLYQRHLLPIRIFHHPAQKVAQLGNHAHCRIVSFLAHEASDGIERVEQKVWLDLPPEGMELCCQKLLVEAWGLDSVICQALFGVQHVTDHPDRVVQEHRLQKDIVGLVDL